MKNDDSGDQDRQAKPDQIAQYAFGDLAAAGRLVAGRMVSPMQRFIVVQSSSLRLLPKDRRP